MTETAERIQLFGKSDGKVAMWRRADSDLAIENKTQLQLTSLSKRENMHELA